MDECLDTELMDIVKEQSQSVSKSYPENSFARMFWDNQERGMSLKNSKSKRWDPLMVRWCLYLQHTSGRAYDMLRESGVIRLPSQRTLRDYTYFTKTTAGYSDDIDKQLMDAAKINSCPEREKYVILLMDEMQGVVARCGV